VLPGAGSGRYDSFAVRIWSLGGSLIHGEVVHLPSQDRIYFKDLAALLAFILDQIADARDMVVPDDQPER
jgi:hypothetical protein